MVVRTRTQTQTQVVRVQVRSADEKPLPLPDRHPDREPEPGRLALQLGQIVPTFASSSSSSSSSSSLSTVSSRRTTSIGPPPAMPLPSLPPTTASPVDRPPRPAQTKSSHHHVFSLRASPLSDLGRDAAAAHQLVLSHSQNQSQPLLAPPSRPPPSGSGPASFPSRPLYLPQLVAQHGGSPTQGPLRSLPSPFRGPPGSAPSLSPSRGASPGRGGGGTTGKRPSVSITRSTTAAGPPPPRPERDPPIWTLRPPPRHHPNQRSVRSPAPSAYDDASEADWHAGKPDGHGKEGYESGSTTDTDGDDRFFDATEHEPGHEEEEEEEDGFESTTSLSRIEEFDDDDLVTPTVASFNLNRPSPSRSTSHSTDSSPALNDRPRLTASPISPQRLSSLRLGAPPSPPPTGPLPPLPGSAHKSDYFSQSVSVSKSNSVSKSSTKSSSKSSSKAKGKAKHVPRAMPKNGVVIPRRQSSMLGMRQAGLRDSETLSMHSQTSTGPSRASSVRSSLLLRDHRPASSLHPHPHPYAAAAAAAASSSSASSSLASSTGAEDLALAEMDLDALLHAIDAAAASAPPDDDDGEALVEGEGEGDVEDDDQVVHPFAVASTAPGHSPVSRPRTADDATTDREGAEVTNIRRPATTETGGPVPLLLAPQPAEPKQVGHLRQLSAGSVEMDDSPVLPWDEGSTSAFPSPPPSRHSPATQLTRHVLGLGLDADALTGSASRSSKTAKTRSMEQKAAALEEEVAAFEACAALSSARMRPASSPQSHLPSVDTLDSQSTRPLSAPSSSTGPLAPLETQPTITTRAGRSATVLSTGTACSVPATLSTSSRQDSFRWSLETASTAMTGLSAASSPTTEKKMSELQEVEEQEPVEKKAQAQVVPEVTVVEESGSAAVDELEVPAHYAALVLDGEGRWSPVSSRRTSRNSGPGRVRIQSPPSDHSNRTSLHRLSRALSADAASPVLSSSSRRPSTVASTGAASDDSRWSTYAQKFLGGQSPKLNSTSSPLVKTPTTPTSVSTASRSETPVAKQPLASASTASLQSSAATTKTATNRTKSFKSLRRVMGLTREKSYPPPSTLAASMSGAASLDEPPPQLALLHIRSQDRRAARAVAADMRVSRSASDAARH